MLWKVLKKKKLTERQQLDFSIHRDVQEDAKYVDIINKYTGKSPAHC